MTGALAPTTSWPGFLEPSVWKQGPCFAAAVCGVPQERRTRLVIAAHHLVMDGVSWRIVLEDLHDAYLDLLDGCPPRLPRPGLSFAGWASRLAAGIGTQLAQASRDYWLREAEREAWPLPRDYPSTGAGSVGGAGRTHLKCPRPLTASLLQLLPLEYDAHFNEILLSALFMSLAQDSGTARLHVDVESHGRRILDRTVDLSRTVGWFTSLFPVRLVAAAPDDGDLTVASVEEQLRAVPDHGLGYGLLRYSDVDQEASLRLAAAPQAELLFNYLGQFDSTLATSASGAWPTPLPKGWTPSGWTASRRQPGHTSLKLPAWCGTANST